MIFKEKGLKVSIDTHSGLVVLTYMYPISFQFYNVFTAGQEAFGYRVVKFLKDEKSKPKYYCQFVATGSSSEVFPAFRKLQYNLMLMSRKAKLNVLESDVKSLEETVKNYESVATTHISLEPIF